ncbi:MAG: beta-lactamase family protein [Acidobacteriia bacterium]|nr:beta-lactamase family protein [Terriglobia bacterium]
MKLLIVSAAVLLVLVPCAWATDALKTATPEQVGLSAERLARIDQAMEGHVDEGHFSGAIGMIVRRGKIGYFKTWGDMDKESGTEMSEDAIFRMYSMTKAVTGVAAMILYEHGHFALTDPISNYLPEFKTMRVAIDEAGPVAGRRKSYTVPADRQITVRDLFMHTAGLSYPGPIAPDGERYFAKTGVSQATTLEEMVKRIAKAPLVQQPGTTWQYGYSTDVLARYVEAVSGMPIDEFFRKNIFEPLGMSDTGYYVPEKKWDRFTVLYTLNDGKKTVRRSTAAAQDSYKQPTTKLGGGSGLVSTTKDYARFCQMLANDGELNGVRILSRKSVELMRADHMPVDMSRAGGTSLAGWGFGLTFAVSRGPGQTGIIGTKGEYRWGGAAGTRFWIDPKEEMVTIFMVQILPYRGLSYGQEFKRLAYQAIVD